MSPYQGITEAIEEYVKENAAFVRLDEIDLIVDIALETAQDNREAFVKETYDRALSSARQRMRE